MENLGTKYKLSWQDKSFLKTFPRRIRSLSTAEREVVRRRFVEIFNSDVSYITDEPSQSHQIMSAYVLAAYETLIEMQDKQEVLGELAEALKSVGGVYIKWSMRIMLWITRNKRRLIENSATNNKAAYGNSFVIVEEKTEDKFVSIVKKCGFYDFFRRNGKPELTKVFCDWDSLWFDEINRQKCGIRFERPTTIANNDEDCRFEFLYEPKV